MLLCNCYFATLYFPSGKKSNKREYNFTGFSKYGQSDFFVIENETVIGIKEGIQVVNSIITFKVEVYILSLQL